MGQHISIAGVYQIGAVEARSCVVIRRFLSILIPKRLAS
jgi:hypothetical protein